MKRRQEHQRRPVDWASVRERLTRAGVATTEVVHVSPDRAKAIMDERARVLAETIPGAAPAEEVVEVLTFSLGREQYALETPFVREVARPGELTDIPGAPDFLLGLTNLHGDVLCVLDLAKVLGFGVTAPTESSRLIVLGTERLEFAIVADHVDEVRTIEKRHILEVSETIPGIGKEYVLGIVGGETLSVLNGHALLEDSRLVIDQGDAVKT